MTSECDFYLDRAAKCLDMAEHLDRQYRGDLVQIARGWVQLAQEEADWDTELGESAPCRRPLDNCVLTPISVEQSRARPVRHVISCGRRLCPPYATFSFSNASAFAWVSLAMSAGARERRSRK